MKKKTFLRALIGAPIGLAISTIITIVISLTVGDGNYYPVVPQLIINCKSEINAVLLQAVCSMLYGAVWSAASVVWEREDWSILRQTATHLAVCSLATFPIAYITQWMKHTTLGILSYFGIFLIIYFIIWQSIYWNIKRNVERMNKKIQENNSPASES